MAVAKESLELAERATKLLDGWLAKFEETTPTTGELKDFVNYLTALKRTLEIARLAENLESDDEEDEELDGEELHQRFFGAD